jgi:signal peptidase
VTDDGRRARLKRSAIGFLKEVAIAFLIVGIVMGCLYAYSGVWPPMVVVESGSMQHSATTSNIGVIDTGDMVLVKTISGEGDVSTYLDGRETGLKTYGDYGEVIIYRPLGNKSDTPIIHRAVAWVEVNDAATSGPYDYDHYTFNIPRWNLTGIMTFTIPDYGYTEMAVEFNLSPILTYHRSRGTVPHSGFITAGDHNMVKYNGGYDQLDYRICPELVSPDWIVGKAFGELPWFGLLKLVVTGGAEGQVPANSWVMLAVCIGLILFVPFGLDIFGPRIRKRWKAWRDKRKGKKEEPPSLGKSGKGRGESRGSSLPEPPIDELEKGG